MSVIDEREFKDKFLDKTAQEFLKFVQHYDQKMSSIMRNRGYKCIQSMPRTVIFTFGEITYTRKRWRRGKTWAIPVDEKLGLQKNSRYSKEFIFQVSQLSTMMPYDKVVQVVELLYRVIITKPTVVQAVKQARELLLEKEDYRYFKEEGEPTHKIKCPIIYVEGDGVLIRAKEENKENRHFDFSHYVIHTGSKQVGKNRYALDNKKEIIDISQKVAKEKVIDYIYNHYEITPDTILVTNSDGGHGYGYKSFKEIASTLGVKHHQHFWDAYHVSDFIHSFYKGYPSSLEQEVLQAIKYHDKKQLVTALDTTESLIISASAQEAFEVFKRRLISGFPYTKPANLRGLPSAGIGVMESQHRKITYRMKKRGMYWSIKGAETMVQMILATYEGDLRDLFFGDWRETYEKIKEENLATAANIFRQQDKIKKTYDLAGKNWIPSKYY